MLRVSMVLCCLSHVHIVWCIIFIQWQLCCVFPVLRTAMPSENPQYHLPQPADVPSWVSPLSWLETLIQAVTSLLSSWSYSCCCCQLISIVSLSFCFVGNLWPCVSNSFTTHLGLSQLLWASHLLPCQVILVVCAISEVAWCFLCISIGLHSLFILEQSVLCHVKLHWNALYFKQICMSWWHPCHRSDPAEWYMCPEKE